MFKITKIKFDIKFWSVVGVMILALILRVYKLDSVPSSLYYDEVDYGYQARSLLETGRDYMGGFSPFYVQSFNDIRTPLPAYLTAISTLIFSQEELEVRMPFVFSGMVSLLMIFLLLKLWTKNFWLSLTVTLVFAVSPWQIQYSRFSHEVGPMLALFLVGLYCFFKFTIDFKYKWLLTSVICLSLTTYTYRTMSLYAPLTLVTLFLLYFKDIWKLGLLKLGILVLISAGVILPFLYATTIAAPDQTRIAQLSVTSDPEAPIWVQVNREIDNRDRVDPSITYPPNIISKLTHNKPLSWLDAFTNNYFHNFSTDFLFTKGDSNNRHNVGQMGHLYLIDCLALIAGIIFLVRNQKFKIYNFLLIWLLTAPIPASITMDGGGHASRLFIFSAPLLIIIGLGWYQIINYLKSVKYKKVFFCLLITVYCLLFANYLHRYFVHYPLEAARYFGYGFKQAVQTIVKVEADYDQIGMVATKDPPMIYFLFWAHIPPKYLQEYGANFSLDNIEGKLLDKYKVVGVSDLLANSYRNLEKLDKKSLYLVTQAELNMDFRKEVAPDNINLLEIIRYPDNEVAFYLISRK